MSDHPSPWLSDSAKRHPDKTAIVTDEGVITYAELQTLVDEAAILYTRNGFDPQQPTAVVSKSRQRIALAVLAGFRSGSPVLPLCPGRMDNGESLRTANITQILHDSDPTGGVRGDTRVLPDSIEMDKAALYMATSGSSDAPKIVMLSGQNLRAAITRSCEQVQFGQDDCWLACLPMHHIGGLSTLLRAVYRGATLVLMEKFEPTAALEHISRHNVSHISLVPAMLSQLVANSGRAPTSLRCVLVGGGALSTDVMESAVDKGWPVSVCYGMTETCAQVTVFDATEDNWQAGMVGKATPGTSIDIVAAADERAVQTGDIGRIRIRGEQVMLGYANEQNIPGIGISAGAFLTSDLGRIDESGNLFFIGRADEAFTSGGYLVHPRQLEARLADCPGIDAVAFAGLPDPDWEHRIVMAYCGNATRKSVAQWCEDHLERYCQPRDIVRQKAIPRTALGKPDRKAIESLLSKAKF